MRGIEGQVAVRIALKPHDGDGGEEDATGPVIDTQGFGSAIFWYQPTCTTRTTQELYLAELSVEECATSGGTYSAIWTCGTSPTIRGTTTTLPQFLDDPGLGPPQVAGQEPRMLVIESLATRQRFMRMKCKTDSNTSTSGETNFYGICFLLDPLESLTTDVQIADTNGQASYIGGAI